MSEPEQLIMTHRLQLASELNNLGVADLGDGELEMASKYLDKAAGLVKGLPGCSAQESNDESQCLVNEQTNVFQREDYDEGMDTYCEPLRISPQNALCHEVYSSILFNQALCYVKRNAAREAYHLFRHSLEVLKDFCCGSEGDHIKMIAVYHNLGRIEYRCGLLENAIETYTKALEIANDSTGNKALLAKAATLNCLSVVYFQLEWADTEKALSLCQASLDTYRSVLGERTSSMRTATVLNNVGRIRFLREEYELALPLYQESLSMRRRLLGNKSRRMDFAATIFNIAQTCQALQEDEEALALYTEFLTIAKDHLGDKHRDIVATLKVSKRIVLAYPRICSATQYLTNC